MSEKDLADRQARLESLVAGVLEQAAQKGASQAEAGASAGAGLAVTVRKQDVETLEYQRDQGLSVTVYFDKRKGSASTSDLEPGSVSETVNKACSLARYGSEDEAAGLADAGRMATEFPDLSLHYPWSIDADQAIKIATECEGAALDVDARITNSEGASVNSYEGCRVYGNSHGFLSGYADSHHSLSCAVLASEGSEMQRDYEFTVARDPAELEAGIKVGQEAAGRTLKRLNARKLDTRNTPVIYPARLARGLFGHAIGAISGGALYRRASFLLDALGEQIFAEHINISEQPFIPKGLASGTYDNEGVAAAERELVSAGILQGYVLGSYYARKLGMESTGNAGGTHNLVVGDTGVGFADLVEEMNTGFIVTELMGQGINAVTGDYSRGASGYWVENGEIAYPVHEMTIAGNLRDIYQGILAVTSDIDCRGGIRCGSLLIDKLTLAGN